MGKGFSSRAFARGTLEIVSVILFVAVAFGVAGGALVAGGYETTGLNRIYLTALVFLGWILFTILLTKLNREPLAEIGVFVPRHLERSIAVGLATATVILTAVVSLELAGFGLDRLGEMATELKGNTPVLVGRMVVSVLVVGIAEELVFRGFIMLRLAKMFGGSTRAWRAAVIVQAILFGATHGYQSLYGMALTGAIGLFLGAIYLKTGRNLIPVAIGHGVYNAAHAYVLAKFIL